MDPGFATTGYGVIRISAERPSDVEVVEAGVIRSKKELSLPLRLCEVYRQVVELIREFSPDDMAVEDAYSLGVFPRSAILIGHVRGVILLAAAEKKLEVAHYFPLQVKKALLGDGHATKSQVQKMIQRTLGLPRPPQPDDVADALAVALCHSGRKFGR